MQFQQTSVTRTSLCPCLMEPLEGSDGLFVVGTYQLIEDHAEDSDNNNREGSLLLLSKGATDPIHDLHCIDGGVFDLKVASRGSQTQPMWTLYVAHANGALGVYWVEENEIKFINRTATDLKMLTCLDLVERGEDVFVAAGDSRGSVCFICVQKQGLVLLVQDTVHELNPYMDPVWCLKLFKLNDSDALMITGSDDSLLKVYLLPDFVLRKKPLLVNKDATAGVTSIEAISEGILTGSEWTVSLLVGSYDEHIRDYQLKVSLEEGSEGGIKVQMLLKGFTRIAEAGIWKLRSLVGNSGDNNEGKRLVLVAGMYSGAHLLSDGQVICSLKQFEGSCDQSEDSSKERGHLVYDVVSDRELNFLVVSSFYHKELYCFKRIR